MLTAATLKPAIGKTKRPPALQARTRSRDGSRSSDRRATATGRPFGPVQTKLQAKLKVGPANDRFEAEAGRVADQVMRMPAPRTADSALPLVGEEAPSISALPSSASLHRMCTDCEEEMRAKPAGDTAAGTLAANAPGAAEAVASGGRGLSASERSFFEPRLGLDLGSVRIHDGSRADAAARSIDARAFTLGNHIAFAGGEYRPGSSEGRRLMAHELAHTVQQGGGDSLRRRPRRRVRRPKLSLYQIDDPAFRHFHAQASNKATEIGAIRLDTSNSCPTRFHTGPTPYRSGQEIIELIAKAYWCTGEQIRELHIFSHGFTGGGGIVAAEAERRGLVTPDIFLSEEHRALGARRVEDIQSEPFAENAVVVLHGCQIGAGENSFAEQMLKHLVGDRPRVRVFAHSQSGVCGRTTDWSEFSARNPEGRRRRVNPFHRPRETVQRTPAEPTGPREEPATPLMRGLSLDTIARSNRDDYHTTDRGDTYAALAGQYGATVRQMRLWNEYPDRDIPIAARLRTERPQILVTYFNAYPGSPVNYSQETVQSIPASLLSQMEDTYQVTITTREVDVSVSGPDGVDQFIQDNVRDNRSDFDVIVSTGEGDADIHFERAAGNAITSSLPDNSGQSQRGQRVTGGLPAGHEFSGTLMDDAAARRGFRRELSGTAAESIYQPGPGLNEAHPQSRYLCNYLTGHLIHQSGQQQSLVSTQFIHLSNDRQQLQANRDFVQKFLHYVCARRLYNAP